MKTIRSASTPTASKGPIPESSERSPARTRRSPKRMRIPASHASDRQSIGYDGDFVAKLITGRERQRVTAPERAGIKPVVMLFGRQQSHLLVGDGDGLRAIRRLQPDLELLRLPALRDLTNLAVHERNSPREVGDR